MKTNNDGFYKLTISDGRKNHSFITLIDEENNITKKIEIIGSQNNNVLEEMISWIKLKYVKNVEEICDRRIYKKEDYLDIIDKLLPKGESFHYHSEPCYQDAIEIPQQEAIKIIQSIREIPNGINQYREKVTELINSSVQNFEIAKNKFYDEFGETKPEDEEEIQNDETITENGFYKLTLSDGVHYHQAITLENKQKLFFLGEYKDGHMTLIINNLELAYIRDIDIIEDRRIFKNGIEVEVLPQDESHYYYCKPCYIKAKKISQKVVLDEIEILKKDQNIRKIYIEEIKRIINATTLDYETVKNTPFNPNRKQKKKKKTKQIIKQRRITD